MCFIIVSVTVKEVFNKMFQGSLSKIIHDFFPNKFFGLIFSGPFFYDLVPFSQSFFSGHFFKYWDKLSTFRLLQLIVWIAFHNFIQGPQIISVLTIGEINTEMSIIRHFN